MSDEGGGVFVTLPLPDQRVFRYQAADDILELLYRHPHLEFTITELRRTTGHGGKSVDTAIQILDSLGLIEKRKDGRRSLITINQARIRKPEDPLLEVPQAEFRDPVDEFVEEATKKQAKNVVGIVLFGSVARGEADRTSDIDIQVIVEDDLVEARRELHDVRQDIQHRKFDGNRYNLQLLVESVDSARRYGEKLQEIFSEGIVLYSTTRFEDVREVIFHGEQ